MLGLRIRQDVKVDGLRQQHRLPNLVTLSLHLDHVQAVSDIRHSLDPLTSLQTAYANGRLGERVGEQQPRAFTELRYSTTTYHRCFRHSVPCLQNAGFRRYRPGLKIRWNWSLTPFKMQRSELKRLEGQQIHRRIQSPPSHKQSLL